MRTVNKPLAVLALAVVVAAAPGCVSKKLFRKQAADTDTRVSSVESAVEANERRIGDLRDETDQKLSAVESKAEQAQQVGNTAKTRADEAANMAMEAKKGRLLWTETLSNDKVKFSFDQAKVPSDAAAVLDELVSKIKGYGKAVYVEIEGHTDNTGSEEYNRQLGEMRANAVRHYLASKGIPLHAMQTISLGESKPVADNSTSAGRAANRRVVIRVLE